MRVLMVHNYYQQRGGEDTVFENERDLLQENGHEVETLTFHNDALHQTSTLQAGIQLFYNPNSAEQLERLIQSFLPQVIHVHNFFPIASPALYQVARRHSIPVIQTLHNFRLLCANALLFRNGQVCNDCVNQPLPFGGVQHGCYRNSRVHSLALTAMTQTHHWLGTWHQGVNRYIVLTDFARQKFHTSRLTMRLDQMTVKPNFVFDSGEGLYADREDYILFIGRLSVEKDIHTLLKAFQQTSVPLVIVGQGPFESDVQRAAQQSRNIHYKGYQDKMQVRDLLKKARGFILPSTCYEGCPMTILEALSTGTPVIVSKIGGLAEFVQHEFNGLHMVPGDAASIVAQAERMSLEDHLHQVLCRNARQSYLDHYTPAANHHQLIQVYESVL